MRAVRLAFALSTLAACRPSSASPEPSSLDPAPRGALFAADHPHRAVFEAPEIEDECTADADCHRAGCGDRICSAQAEVMSTCEVLPVSLPADATCGCLDGACRWWSPSEATPIATAEPQPVHADEPAVGPCATVRCAAPTQCIEYFVNEAPQGRMVAACEVPCAAEEPACPPDMGCITLVDGPGRVCRPAGQETAGEVPPPTSP